MGSGRATALWSPKIGQWSAVRGPWPQTKNCHKIVKNGGMRWSGATDDGLRTTDIPHVFVEYYTQGRDLEGVFTTRLVLKSLSQPLLAPRENKDQASRPISISPLSGLRHLHA